MSPLNRMIRHAVLVISLLMGISAVVMGFASQSGSKPAWALFGFEVVILVAAVLGILFGFGKFKASPGMALACIGGTFFVATVLGWMSITASAGQARQVGGIALNPVAGLRILGAVLVLGAAAIVVLGRQRAAWRPAIVGGLLAAPVTAACLLFLYPPTRSAVQGLLFGSAAGAVLAFVIITALLASGVHLLVRGFEIGSGEEPPATSKKA